SNGGGGHQPGGKHGTKNFEDAAYDAISGINDPCAKAAAYSAAWYPFSAWKFDAWLYRNVPSAFGWQVPYVGGSGMLPLTAGVGPTAEVSETYIFNWRSMELTSYGTFEKGPSAGIPGGLSGSGGVTVFTVMGASSNSSWEGPYKSSSVQ